jgi:peptidoglycan/xylan/chitin deacetylase (PgdA/CDA1 family)
LALGLLLGGCGSSTSTTTEPIAWQFDPTPTTASVATPAVQTALPAAMPLTASQLRAAQPNELGVVPILEYHVITTDPAEEAQFVRTKDDFIADLTWLYENDFHVIPMRELLENRISAPAGKLPVVLTFDDGQSSQFSATRDAAGNIVPDPDSAVGILEAFFAEHPDFGHTAHFGIVANNCFAYPDESQRPLCHDKLRWLGEHGYEVGNHTYNHANLYDLDDETFMRELGETKLFIDRYVSGPGNLGDVLTVPFGEYPNQETRAYQQTMMQEGFEYKGETIKITAALMVGANPTVSPNSTEWDPMFLARVQAFDESLDLWFDACQDGSVPYYVSDGMPEVVTIPDPLPAYVANEFDPDVVAGWGRDLVVYDPDSGTVTASTIEEPGTANRMPGFEMVMNRRDRRAGATRRRA